MGQTTPPANDNAPRPPGSARTTTRAPPPCRLRPCQSRCLRALQRSLRRQCASWGEKGGGQGQNLVAEAAEAAREGRDVLVRENILGLLLTFLFHPEFHQSNRHLSQKIRTIRRSYFSLVWYPLTMLLLRCLFLPHHDAGSCWLLQAPLPQRCPIQAQRPHLEVLSNVAYAWFGRIPAGGGVSNSIKQSLVHIFPFYFGAVLTSHPCCPACIDLRRAPSPTVCRGLRTS